MADLVIEGRVVTSPDSQVGASLSIEVGLTPTAVTMRAGPGFEPDLRRLAIRFQSSTQISPNAIEIELDELLTNLVALTTWREPSTVQWEDGLATLVADSAADAVQLDRDLGPSPGSLEFVESDIGDLLPGEWIGDLTWFQRRDLAKIMNLRHGANFSVPGAGKTRVGLATYAIRRRQEGLERLLVVGPKSSFESWQDENDLCMRPPLRMQVYSGLSDLDPTAEALLVNYERLAPALDELGRWITARPAMLLIDEAHRMKLGPQGVYGAACLALGTRARRRLILTGTPVPNDVRDLENLFGFVWPGLGRQRVRTAMSGRTLAEASQLLSPLYSRTTKDELGLPPVTPVLRSVELPPLHREIYDALTGQFSLRAAGVEGDFLALGRISMYMLMAAISPALLSVGTTRYEPLAYQVPPIDLAENTPLFDLMRDLPNYEVSPKYLEALAIVDQNSSQSRKTIVWSTFIRSLNTLARMMDQFQPATVHGGTEDRVAEIDRFRNDPDCMVLLSNPATLGEGISLHQVCHDAVYVDRDFSAGKYLQSLDRIHRLGLPPDTETRISVLVSRDTIDDVVTQRLDDKVLFMRHILDDPALQQVADLDEVPSVGAGLDRQDIQALMGYLRDRDE